jgi:hypothetical protein
MWKTARRPAGGVGVDLDVVADRVRGPEPDHAARPEPALGLDPVEHRLALANRSRAVSPRRLSVRIAG